MTFVTQMERGSKDFVTEDCDGLDIVFEVNVGLSCEDGLASTEDVLTAYASVAAGRRRMRE